MKKYAFAAALLFCLPLPPLAGALLQLEFRGTLDSGFGGLPSTSIHGRFRFENTAPARIYNNGRSADFRIQSFDVWINGEIYSALIDTGYQRVDNDLDLGGGQFRDSYSVSVEISGLPIDEFRLDGIGLEFEQSGPPVPAALDSLALPSSPAYFAGFQGPRSLFLRFAHPDVPTGFASHGALALLEVSEVADTVDLPEPGAMGLVLFGGAAVIVLGRAAAPLPRL